MTAEPGTGLVRLSNASQAAELALAAGAAEDYIRQAKAPTVRAYRNDWHDFCTWCENRGLSPLPATPDTVALYVSDLAATHKPATLTRRMSAISQAHQFAGHESPTNSITVRTVMAGIRRAKGTALDAKTPTLGKPGPGRTANSGPRGSAATPRAGPVAR